MKKIIASTAMLACLTVTACTTTNIQSTTNEFKAKSESSDTLMIAPDVEMSAILASGVLEPRVEWSENAKANLQAALEAELKARASNVIFMDENAQLTDEQVQVLKLKDAVLEANKSYFLLKNKKDTFDLTLGPDASVLVGDTGADYALLTFARGSFQTAGKMAVNAAMFVLAATAGVGYIQTGQQQATVSLVDLSTGDIVWTNTASLASSDPRKPEGAKSVAETLLKEFPL